MKYGSVFGIIQKRNLEQFNKNILMKQEIPLDNLEDYEKDRQNLNNSTKKSWWNKKSLLIIMTTMRRIVKIISVENQSRKIEVISRAEMQLQNSPKFVHKISSPDSTSNGFDLEK